MRRHQRANGGVFLGSEHILTRRLEAPPFPRRQLLVDLEALAVGLRLVYWRLQRPHLC